MFLRDRNRYGNIVVVCRAGGYDVVITDRRQNAPLPVGVRWAYYATFANPLKAAVAFGVCDIRQS